jgi:Fe-S oxidoreductase
MIDKWLELASLAPRVTNFLSRAPGVSPLLRRALHLAPQRQLPLLAPYSFHEWARKHRGEIERKSATAAGNGREILLWVDTFNNYFRPEVTRAAFDVLTDAGFKVTLPAHPLCCGRPLYDFGMLDRAKKYLERILQGLGKQIDSGLPIVVLEPSCASVFRDELHNLFPTDPRAGRLRNQAFLLGEFLEHHASGYTPPRLSRKVFLHGHCHQKALMKMNEEESLLRKMGVDLQSIDSGCCGMAGPFGFEKEKYAISQAVGERVLLPAVRQTPQETLIVSDGFSCREQILQGTGRRAIHLAEAIQLAAASRESPDNAEPV